MAKRSLLNQDEVDAVGTPEDFAALVERKVIEAIRFAHTKQELADWLLTAGMYAARRAQGKDRDPSS